MALDASYKSDLLHIEAIIAELERIAERGDEIAPTSLINVPDYWRCRIEGLLGRQDISGADRKHAQAVMDRLHRIADAGPEK
ncbi:hypothetical protein LJ656_06325 [Paraburkholderia sp. MMS20-SJTR3]|uniref:Addiction module component n=1 Tax=Paraburkholderia sejongensis TaxID=2886946 RepID=A0ABS8JQK9_9BURK|nr:hypothetical protein [Paraburkholderia sp. MMS20-SJTR3]MCC8392200.1 hypothetical protein [Paraburkholderia sp. MMS20-SJTR3]